MSRYTELSGSELIARAGRNINACELAASASGLTNGERRDIQCAYDQNSLIYNVVAESTPAELLPGIRLLADAADEMFTRTVLPIAKRARDESDEATEAVNRVLAEASGATYTDEQVNGDLRGGPWARQAREGR